MSQRITLKVDVDTLRGTREGVPALLELFRRYRVRATFLFSLGPDHTGRAIRRVFRPGFLGKVGRTSVLEHYGLKTLLYGTVLPGPHIGKRCAPLMREVAEAGHEVGIHTYDHIRWQDFVARRDETWTQHEFDLAVQAYHAVFGRLPHTHGAAGWQMNSHAFRLEDQAGFRYASDTRGQTPFRPVVEDELLECVQLPTTLPTLDELIGLDGLTVDNVHTRVLADSHERLPHGHVYTLHAELEGMKLLPVLETLIANWQADGYTIDAMDALYASLDPTTLPFHRIDYSAIAGRSGNLARQGEAVTVRSPHRHNSTARPGAGTTPDDRPAGRAASRR